MKFVIKKNIIENVVSSMQPFLDKKDASAITSHVYLKVENDILIIKATDLEIRLEAKIDSMIDSENGEGTINGINLLEILKRLRKLEFIIVETKKNNLIIKQNRAVFKLPMYNAKEYPSIEKKDELNKLDINIKNFINSIKKITPSIDNSNPKQELNSALIDINQNKTNFVSTDTRRLSVAYIENISNIEKQFIIPKKAILEIQKLFLDNAEVFYNDINLIVKNENITFYTKLVNGKFPSYDKIIPKNFKHKFLVHKNTLIESIKLVTSLFSGVKITFNSNNILFESLDGDSEAKTQIDANLDIEDKSFYFAVDSKHLLDFLNLSKGENITIGFNESTLPFYLESKNFFTVIMPIVLEE